jgi:hypothetical protein
MMTLVLRSSNRCIDAAEAANTLLLADDETNLRTQLANLHRLTLTSAATQN